MSDPSCAPAVEPVDPCGTIPEPQPFPGFEAHGPAPEVVDRAPAGRTVLGAIASFSCSAVTGFVVLSSVFVSSHCCGATASSRLERLERTAQLEAARQERARLDDDAKWTSGGPSTGQQHQAAAERRARLEARAREREQIIREQAFLERLEDAVCVER